ncbi:MAG TPA: hypothetical protein VK509_18255 [Polyangiales bacterium]|nr:hypothetical protein [Polyangiales bacterium]
MTERAALSLCCCALAGACVQGAPPGEASEGDRGQAIELRVLDQRRDEVGRSAVPRRPQLWLAHPRGLQPDPETVVLLTGRADADLREDLGAAPLRAEHATRIVPCALAVDPASDELVLAPLAVLERGAAYTLAVAGNARAADGSRMFADGAAWLMELRTDDGPDGGAHVIASWPADGAASVATNLAAAVIALDGHVEGASQGAWLEGPDGLAVPAEISSAPCAELAPEHSADSCIRIAPSAPLAPSAPYAIVLGSAVTDAHGAAVGPYRASFRCASSADTHGPALRTASCAIDEQATRVGCALIDDQSITLRVVADEPARFALLGEVGQAPARALAPAGEAVLQLSGLMPGESYALELELRDAADNLTRERLSLRTEAALATLSISELRADPLGPEPAQELVELLNYGSRPIQLQGFSLGDRLDALGPAIAGEAVVQPAARALLVADGFDPHEPSEPQPPAGALLVRVGKALAAGGLRNSGEPLYLRDREGRRVSAAPGLAPRAGRCLLRIGADMRSGDAAAFEHSEEAGCTPGW